MGKRGCGGQGNVIDGNVLEIAVEVLADRHRVTPDVRSDRGGHDGRIGARARGLLTVDVDGPGRAGLGDDEVVPQLVGIGRSGEPDPADVVLGEPDRIVRRTEGHLEVARSRGPERLGDSRAQAPEPAFEAERVAGMQAGTRPHLQIAG